MAFRDRSKKIKTKAPKLILEQRKAVVTHFADGKSRSEVRKAMLIDFNAGEYFHPLINEVIKYAKTIESLCDNAMSQEVQPADKTALKTAIEAVYPEENASFIGHVVNKIVEATGTWAEYKNTFTPIA